MLSPVGTPDSSIYTLHIKVIGWRPREHVPRPTTYVPAPSSLVLVSCCSDAAAYLRVQIQLQLSAVDDEHEVFTCCSTKHCSHEVP